MDLQAACFVNSRQGKDAGVLYRLNYLIHQHTGIRCDTSFWIYKRPALLIHVKERMLEFYTD